MNTKRKRYVTRLVDRDIYTYIKDLGRKISRADTIGEVAVSGRIILIYILR
jgi:hypothetical protein